MEAAHCPSPEELRQWQAGDLSTATAQQISQHIAECAACRNALPGQPPRAAAGDTRNLQRSQSVEVIIADKPSSAQLKLLQPPQASDELGRIAHFHIRRVIGEGGMGVVYEGFDSRLERTVAIKILKPEQAHDEISQKRFLQEVRAAASIKSDHIVTIYHVGKEDGVPYFAMELLTGTPLDRHLRRVGKLPLAEAVRIGRDIALGLAAAHERGLIHRDIKPSNLWLEDPDRRVKILDFGLARSQRREERLTETGHIMGTPDYMSPEQARGKELDPRSDLFSLGSVLYELCTGRTPFEAETITGVLTALAVDTPEPIRHFEPSVPPALEQLVQQLLEKKPEDRPASARAVADRLRQILSATSVAHGMPTAVQHEPGLVPMPPEPLLNHAATLSGPHFDRHGQTEPVAPLAARRRRPRLGRGLLLLGSVLLLAYAVYYGVTARGSVLVITENPDIDIRIYDPEHGNELVLTPRNQQDYAVPPGRYQVTLLGPEADDYFVEGQGPILDVHPWHQTRLVIRKKFPGWQPAPPPGGDWKSKGPKKK